MKEILTTSHSNNSEESEIKAVIRSIFIALSADYGDKFLSQFRLNTDYQPDAWKWRLYKRVYGCNRKAIAEGFEELIDRINGPYPPSMDDIVVAIKRRQRELIEEETPKKDNPKLQFSGGIPGYIDALGNANIGNPAAQRTIKEIREILNR